MNAATRHPPKVRLCGCSHEQARHALVDGKPIGPCLHGCGCERFHSRRFGGGSRFALPSSDPFPVPIPPPAVELALVAIERARAALLQAEAALRSLSDAKHAVPEQKKPQKRSMFFPEPRAHPGRIDRPIESSSHGLTRGERRVLTAVAQHRDQGGASKELVTILTGYKRSSRDTYLQSLRARSFITEHDQRIQVTPSGQLALGSDYELLPTGRALLDHWRAHLPAGERLLLDVVVSAYPRSVDKESLSRATGYKRSSRDTYLQKLRVRRLVRVNEDGSIEASSLLFDVGELLSRSARSALGSASDSHSSVSKT